MDKKNEISIEWEASGYSVLKNLNASILGIFSEFIDNSIQSFNNDKELIKKYDEDAQLIIKILASTQYFPLTTDLPSLKRKKVSLN